MEKLRISAAPLSGKVFMSMALCITGLTYILFLIHIWIDTELKAANIITAYGAMEYIELTNHAHIYMPYYFIYLFLIPITIFMFSSYSEKLKLFFAFVPVGVITIDIASMYLIPYFSKAFAYVLWFVGVALATMFFTMFVMNMYDMWLKKPKAVGK